MDSYFGTWTDDSDPEARQDAEADAREDSLLEQEPPLEVAGQDALTGAPIYMVALPLCGACGGLGGGCCDVAAMEASR